MLTSNPNSTSLTKTHLPTFLFYTFYLIIPSWYYQHTFFIDHFLSSSKTRLHLIILKHEMTWQKLYNFILSPRINIIIKFFYYHRTIDPHRLTQFYETADSYYNKVEILILPSIYSLFDAF